MEKYFIEKPVKVFCVTADDFPSGIKAAHERLHSLLPVTENRKFYGISRGAGKGKIIYKAATAEQYDGEAAEYNCEEFIIQAGNYVGKVLKNWRDDETVVAKTFTQLLSLPDVLPGGYCLEEYLDENDMRCMITVR